MATPTVQLGILSDLYLNNGTYNTPNTSAVLLVGDMTVPAKWDVADIPIRFSRMKLKAKTMVDVGVTGKLLASKADANYTTILNAMNADTVLNVFALNGGINTNGVRGYMFDSQVVNATEDQGPGAVVFDEFELIPTYTGNAPNAVLVTAGAPVLTPL
jgi:hypothetical protein